MKTQFVGFIKSVKAKMMKQLCEDVKARPGAFLFLGPFSLKRLEGWSKSKKYLIPDELMNVWSTIGAGRMFETYALLIPSVDVVYQAVEIAMWDRVSLYEPTI